MIVSKLKLGVVTSYVTMFMNNIMSLLFTPFLIHSLGKSQYGIFSLMGIIIGYMSLLDLGFGNTLIRYIAKYRAERDSKGESQIFSLCFLIYSGISVVVLILGIIFYSQITSMFNQGLSKQELEIAKVIFCILIINLVIAFPLNSFSGVMRGYEKFTFLNIANILRVILRICILVILLKLGYKAITVVLVDTILNLILGLINVVYVLFVVKIRIIKPEVPFKFIMEIVRYSFLSFIISLSGLIIWQIGNIMLGMYAGAISVAVYAIGLQFTNYYMNIAGTISTIFIPRITMMITNNVSKIEITNFLIRIARVQFIILGFVLGGFIVFGKPFLTLWLGPDFLTSWVLAIILMIPQTFTLLLSVPGSMLVALNKHRFKALISILNAVIISVVIYYLVQKYGTYGAAVGTSIGMLLAEIIIMSIYYHIKLKIDMLIFWKRVCLHFIPIVSMTIIIFGFITKLYQIDSWIAFFVEGIAYTLIYSTLIYKLGANEYEKTLISSPIVAVLNSIKGIKKTSFGE